MFWQKQNEAVAARKAALAEASWSEVVVLETGEHFHTWEYEKSAKKKGGKVYVEVTQRGEVVIHEGYLSRKEAARAKRTHEPKKDGQPVTADHPEVSSVLQNYLDLHRHAAVRARLDAPSAALRLMVAHAIGGSGRWQVRADPQLAKNDSIARSVEQSAAETAFRACRSEIAALLGSSDDRERIAQGNGDSYQTVDHPRLPRGQQRPVQGRDLAAGLDGVPSPCRHGAWHPEERCRMGARSRTAAARLNAMGFSVRRCPRGRRLRRFRKWVGPRLSRRGSRSPRRRPHRPGRQLGRDWRRACVVRTRVPPGSG